jgi:hypothetical protein
MRGNWIAKAIILRQDTWRGFNEVPRLHGMESFEALFLHAVGWIGRCLEGRERRRIHVPRTGSRRFYEPSCEVGSQSFNCWHLS